MSKMADKELDIKEKLKYIAIILFIIVLAILVYAQESFNIRIDQTKENRINSIEARLEQQMNYIHQLEADVDNLYRVVEHK